MSKDQLTFYSYVTNYNTDNINTFLELFGEEGNLIVVGVKDSTLLTVEKLNAWNTFSKHFNS